VVCVYQRLKRRRNAGEINGFTLIEILIVIVVLGILAAVVLYALGGIGSKSAVASCEADGSTVSAALADFNNINPHLISMIQGTNQGSDVDFNSPPSSYSDATSADAVLTNKSLGGPFIQSWPNNYPHYAFQLAWEEVPGTGTNATTNPGLWSLKLQVATGNKQSGTSPNFTYAAAGGAGNLVPVATSTNQNVPGSAYAPWLDYSGPGTCTGVS
jgi:prepilin-type N-terminal cleavage/methylation domain-containing protein